MQKKLDEEQRCANNKQQMNQNTALKVGTGKELKTWQTYKHYIDKSMRFLALLCTVLFF